jgi:hypothetical protein
VIDPQTAARLQDIVRRESLSPMMYVGDAYPWTSYGNHAAADKLRSLVAAERQALNHLGLFLTKRKVGLRYIGSFPASFTTLNFLALDAILPRLIDFEDKSVKQLEADLPAITDPDAKALVEKLLQTKRENWTQLTGLQATLKQPASA